MKKLTSLIISFTAIFSLSLSFSTFSQAEEITTKTFKLEGHEVKLPGPILFKPASFEIMPESKENLILIKEYLEKKSYISLLRIEGHTDNSSSSEKSLKLSTDRALAVADWLIKNGVDCKRLIAVGFGETKPVADNSTPEGKSLNRRISFFNAELKGHAIGGMPVDGGGISTKLLCQK